MGDVMSISDSEQNNLLDRLAEEFADRFRRGERPALKEYTDRFPELADDIRELFPAMVKVEQAEGALQAGEAIGDSRAANPPLREIGDYRILREIGRGGMGVVYEAEQISLGRRVALKVLPRHVSSDRMVQERFRREARAAARLHHTNIVPVYEVGQDGDVRFYAMQFIQGQGLEAVINELRRLRDRSAPEAKIRVPSLGEFPQPSGEHSRRGIQNAALGEGMACSPVLRSILTGRFDPGGWRPDVVEGSPLDPAGAASGRLTTLAGTGIERQPNESDPALARTQIESDRASDTKRPKTAYPPGPGLSSSVSSSPSSAVLPGGTQLSTVESGRHAFFRSLAHIGRQVAGVLAYAHARGIVHRDIKPSNLLLDAEGVVWITDFGLAKGDDEGLTQSGDILGTIRYMAPERFRGEGDARADVYAVGLTLYELLTLRSGFSSSDRLALIEQIKTEEPERPRAIDARIPRDLETIVLKAIEKDPKARYRSAEAMGEDLRRFVANEPIRARQVSAPERCWRWARRNPMVATLGGVLTAVLFATTVGSLLAMERFRAQAGNERTLAAEEAAARGKADLANAGLRASEEELRRTVYATRSNLALAAWDAADAGRLRSLLDLLRPAPGEQDLRGWEWRYLWQLGHEDWLTLRAQADNFLAVAFSPDGKTLAAAEWQGRIQLWDRQTGEPRLTTGVTTEGRRAGLDGGVSALAFSPDGRSLAGPGPGRSLMLYAVDTGLPTLSFEGTPEAVLSLAFSPDGRSLVAALAKHRMRIWDANDGHFIHRDFGGHAGPVAAVAFSPDGRTIASASYDRTVKLWKPKEKRQPLAILKGHTDEVRAVAFSPDGRRLASAGLDRTLRVWDAASWAPVNVIRGHTGAGASLAYLPDSVRVLTGSADETVRVWDTASSHELRAFKGHAADVTAVAVNPDGRDFASTGGDRTLRVWDAASPPRPRTLESPSVLTYGGGVECVAFSPDGRRLASGHDDNALRVWELPSGKTLHVIKGHTKRIMCVVFSRDGRTIASGANDGTVRLWDAATGGPRITFTGHTDAIRGIVVTPDGNIILSGGSDASIQAWDAATGVVRYTLRGHPDGVTALTLSPDGRTLASAGYDDTASLWDLPSGQPRATLRGHTIRITSVAFSPDGQTVATSSYDHSVRLWDAADGSLEGTLLGHIDAVDSLAFSPDGRLASSGADKTIRLWDAASGQTLRVLKGHVGRIGCISFSPDGRTLASASHDRTIKLWEATPADVLAAARSEAAPETDTKADDARLRSSREKLRPTLYATSSKLALAASEASDVLRLRFLLELMKPRQDEPDLRGWEWHYLNRLAHWDRSTLRGHDREVKQVAFSPDGRTLASVHRGGRVRLWELATASVRLTLQPPLPPSNDAPQSGVYGVAFSPDGERLAGPGPNGNLGIWNTQTGALLRHFKVSSQGTPTVAFSPDGRSIVTSSTSQKLRIWDALGGSLDANGYGPMVRLFENAHKGTVERAVFSPDGRRVASTGGGTIKLWDVAAGKLHAALPSPNVQVFALAFSPDGRTLVSGGSDHLVHIWDAESGRERRQLSGQASTVTALAFRSDGRELLSAGSDAVVTLWEIDSGRQLSTFKEESGRVCWDAFSPDGKTLASSTFDRMLKISVASHPQEPLVLKSSLFTKNGVSSDGVAISPDGRRIATGYGDHAVRVWDTTSARVGLTLTGHEKPVVSVAFSPSGETIASASRDNTLRLWDAATGGLRFRFAQHTGPVNSARFSPDGRRLVSASDDGTVKVWDAATGQCVLSIPSQSGAVRVVKYSPDGRSIASAGFDGRIRLWNAETGQLLATIAGHADLVLDLAFSPDGQTIASSSNDKTVILSDAGTGERRRTLDGHTAQVDCLAFSPDGRRLVSAGHDQTVRLWELASGADLLTLKGHSNSVKSVAFSGDGRQIASAGDDGTIIVWGTAPAAPQPPAKEGF
jgi:eukaryotic-like serine/threonine-protein kinase